MCARGLFVKPRRYSVRENVDHWVKDLRSKETLCEFGEQEDLMIRDKIVFSGNDERVKERLLWKSELTLVKTIDVCRVAKTTKAQLKVMASEAKVGTRISMLKKDNWKSTTDRDSRTSRKGSRTPKNHGCKLIKKGWHQREYRLQVLLSTPPSADVSCMWQTVPPM